MLDGSSKSWTYIKHDTYIKNIKTFDIILVSLLNLSTLKFIFSNIEISYCQLSWNFPHKETNNNDIKHKKQC